MIHPYPHLLKKIPVINGFRGLAILGIIYFHIWGSAVTKPGWHAINIGSLRLLPFTFLSNTFQGVALFFLLSGFVLYLPFAHGERPMQSRQDVWNFYKRRASRLLPLYAICVLISMIYLHPVKTMAEFFGSFAMMATTTFIFSDKQFMPVYNFVLWTIGIEIWFSLLLPLLIIAIRKMNMRTVFISLLALGMIARLLGTWTVLYGHLRFNVHTSLFLDNIVCRIDDFGWGMLLAHLYACKKDILHEYGYASAGVLSLLIGFMMRDYAIMGILSLEWGALSNILVDGGFFLIIAATLVHTKGIIARSLKVLPLQMCGLMCYSLYIWHGIAMVPLGPLWDVGHLLRYLTLLFALSFLTYRYIENGHVMEWRKLLPEREEE